MQTALHYAAPTMLSQYQQPHSALNLNRAPNTAASVMPSPSVPTRKRKRAHQYTVSYSEVQEVDNAGRLREVIVIEDTPPPSTVSPATSANAPFYSASYQPPVYSAPVRTRARAAAEAQAVSTSSSSAAVAPAHKKRKRDPVDVAGTALKKLATNFSNVPSGGNSCASGSGHAADDVSASLFLHCLFASLTSTVTHTGVQGPLRRQRGTLYHCPRRHHLQALYVLSPCSSHRSCDRRLCLDRTVRLLGQGTFGKVVEAIDTETSKRVAIKIIRAIPKYRDASKIEVRVLQKLKERDPTNKQ